MSKLINLHTNTEYSLLESTIKIDSLISYAKENGLDTLAITDHNVLYGAAEFISKCQKANIKPIIGLDLDVLDYRLILLAKNYNGYKHLMKLSSKKVRGKTISLEDIEVNDVFIIDHPKYGYYQKYQQSLVIYNYFVGLSEGDLPNGVAVNEIKIMDESENKALSILHSIKEGETKEFNAWPLNKENNKLSKDMILQANLLASECNIVFPKHDSNLPKFKTPDNISAPAYLKRLVMEGAKKKLLDVKDIQTYNKRIKYEVGVIEKLGFSDYFLIIWDLIIWAKKQGIAVGPGRGSAAGSIVSYLLDITDVDPIQFDLLFERFLNPERISMPDIDIDIQDSRRDEVIKYMFDKYGESHAALIITYSKLGAKMALRDTAKSMDILPREFEQMSKLIKVGETLSSTYKKVANFRAAIERNPKLEELFYAAKSIEGLPRNVGTHAAGVVISEKPILDSIPTTVGLNDYNQTQFSMDYMERNGLLKIDILGLRNLTIIQEVQAEIFNNYNKKLNLDKISLNDKLTNELLSNIDTNGVFQLESYGMKNTLAQVGVDSFNDLAAVISLFRPGPMEFIGTYANRKKGTEQVPSISKEYDEITKDTYGIIIYQEQIMQIAQEFAGMSFGQADILRRAISKKKKELIDDLKQNFVDGALSKGQPQEKIDKVYKSIEAFAQYGFNKSHAISYALIAYRMAFLKARFPLEFYTAILNSSIDSQKSVQTYINEAKTKSIQVQAPNVNDSENIVLNKNKVIIMPLKLIKGFGTVAQNKLLEERKQNGEFKDFFSFVARVKIAGINNSTIEYLIGSNALKQFGNMQTLFDSLPSAIRYCEMITITKDDKKILDFNLIAKPRLVFSEQNIKQEIISENKLLGMNYNVFYTDQYQTKERLSDLTEKDEVTVAIYVDRIFKRKDKNNNTFVNVLCHDSTNNIEFTIFADTWKKIDKSSDHKVYMATITKRKYNGKTSYIMRSRWKEADE